MTSKVTWTSTYHAGPEKTGTNEGWRHLYDTTLLLTPTAKLSSYVNFDYGVDKNVLIETLELVNEGVERVA